jgi:16S rRNA (guanine527-N7)-methyltransferase
VFAEILRQKLRNGDLPSALDLTDSQIGQLAAHYDLMLKWNRTLNLTTVTDLEQAVERHYCESLFLGAHLPAAPLRIVDIGSGPGFPGFPVAVFRPDCLVTLVESHQRKAVFLKEASRAVPHVRVISKRAEGLDRNSGFDHVISRAVSYDDLGRSLNLLGGTSYYLLAGADPPPSDWGFTWESIQLPWGRERYLRIGKRVSRET